MGRRSEGKDSQGGNHRFGIGGVIGRFSGEGRPYCKNCKSDLIRVRGKRFCPEGCFHA